MREVGQKIANTFRTFAEKPEKEYGGKKILKGGRSLFRLRESYCLVS
jgi:hypothetical protein